MSNVAALDGLRNLSCEDDRPIKVPDGLRNNAAPWAPFGSNGPSSQRVLPLPNGTVLTLGNRAALSWRRLERVGDAYRADATATDAPEVESVSLADGAMR